METIFCPACHGKFVCPLELKGKTGACPHCQKELIMPSDSNSIAVLAEKTWANKLIVFFVYIGVASGIVFWVSTWNGGLSNFISNGFGFAMLAVAVVSCLSGIWGLFGKEFVSSSSAEEFSGKMNALSNGKQIICPNQSCGYTGPGKRTGGTSVCLLLVLLLLGIIPGILYLLFAGRPGIVCPNCGIRIR